MKMRYGGRSVTNRHCEILLELVSGAFDMHEALRHIRDASKKMDFYVNYSSRTQKEQCPYVFIKYAGRGGRPNSAYITVTNTLEANKKKILIQNKGFPKDDLETLADLIILELAAGQIQPITQPKSQPCQSEQLDLFQLAK
jgi:hypothetical protein